MLFYEMDFQVWKFRQEWIFDEPCSEVLGSKINNVIILSTFLKKLI